MLVLLGCAALAVDVGMLYATRAQLQNGADAGALAVAQDCALNGTPACQPRAAVTSNNLADTNSNSGLADASVTIAGGTGTVTVNTSASNSDGPGAATMFANVFGISTVQVGATASAAWGGPYAGTAALPLAFSECQFNLSGTTQVIAYHDGPSCVSGDRTSAPTRPPAAPPGIDEEELSLPSASSKVVTRNPSFLNAGEDRICGTCSLSHLSALGRPPCDPSWQGSSWPSLHRFGVM